MNRAINKKLGRNSPGLGSKETSFVGINLFNVADLSVLSRTLLETWELVRRYCLCRI
jgi:hypothetical protein